MIDAGNQVRRLLMYSSIKDEAQGARVRSVIGHGAKLGQRLNFSVEKLPPPEYRYVAWLDLLGAGHLMSTSMGKSANAIARLHLAVDIVCSDIGFAGSRLAINDGIFIESASKQEIMSLVRNVLTMLGGHFLISSPHNRTMVRAAIAFGPVYRGTTLSDQLNKARREKRKESLARVLFGPPVIQAYRHEHEAPPFGVALHESARSFVPTSTPTRPFVSSHWGWWTSDEYWNATSPVPELAEVLGYELIEQLSFLERTQILQQKEFTKDKMAAMRKSVADYFFGGSPRRPPCV